MEHSDGPWMVAHGNSVPPGDGAQGQPRSYAIIIFRSCHALPVGETGVAPPAGRWPLVVLALAQPPAASLTRVIRHICG
jgi:hypothetical protein